uniref:Uncharacterized protein n=1 Tax=Setaria viridis TaxID=4556 RepID=A0A4U6VTS9_SETVI|nr:hypothetical protein SEVIR_2G160500v2 [Setaria viridis]
MAPLNLDLRPHSIVRGALLQLIQSTSRQGHPRSPKLKKMRASRRRQPWAHRSPASNQSKAADCAVEGPWRGQVRSDGWSHRHWGKARPWVWGRTVPSGAVGLHAGALPV